MISMLSKFFLIFLSFFLFGLVATDVFGRALAIGASFFRVGGLVIGDYCCCEPVVSGVLAQLFAVVWAVILCFLANAAEEIPDTNAGGAPPNVVRACLGRRDGVQTDRCGASPLLCVLIDSVLAGLFVYAPN